MIIIAGWGQLVLALGSLTIPRLLGWKEDTAKLIPLTRQVFWTYAAYIWTINCCFGLLSIFGPHLLTDGSALARCVCGFMGVYWAGRVFIQFFYFDRSFAPSGLACILAEVALVVLFIYLTITYGTVAIKSNTH